MLSKTHQLNSSWPTASSLFPATDKKITRQKIITSQSTAYLSSRIPSTLARIYEITSAASKAGPRNLRVGQRIGPGGR
ncbi:MAG TPA: hypothetical protein VEQ38_19815 [Verrucomicrobiae bacterium]|nr:hypothetical protein [Verrucomicrobiae bacterium]